MAGEDLSWYWKPWFFEHGFPDLAITDTEITDQVIKVKIAKIGKLPVPVKLTAYFEDATIEKVYHSASVWKDGKNEITIDIPNQSKLSKLELGNGHIPDVNRENDVFIP